MTAATPDVALVEPRGWSDASDIAPPKITSSASLTSFRAWRSPAGDAVLVRGCVASSIPGWVEDMRPAIEARTIALVGAATERITGFPIDARPDPARSAVFALRPAARLTDSPIGLGRPLVGFDDAHVLTCFASCVALPAGDAQACESAVVGAHLSPDPTPPPPGMLLGAATWAVHHPRSFAEGAGLLVGALAVLSVLFRPRARYRSSRIVREK